MNALYRLSPPNSGLQQKVGGYLRCPASSVHTPAILRCIPEVVVPPLAAPGNQIERHDRASITVPRGSKSLSARISGIPAEARKTISQVGPGGVPISRMAGCGWGMAEQLLAERTVTVLHGKHAVQQRRAVIVGKSLPAEGTYFASTNSPSCSTVASTASSSSSSGIM